MNRRDFFKLLMSPIAFWRKLMAPELVERSRADVHTEHCCVEHGCKYGDDDCTVINGDKDQNYPCEWCDDYEEE